MSVRLSWATSPCCGRELSEPMPGYINKLRYTFTTPGTYRVLCLEYCGVAHHEMAADITVAAR